METQIVYFQWSTMTSPRTLLNAWRLRPRKRLGQNFLSDPATAANIAAGACLTLQDVVVEIGAGLGALTIPVAQRVKKVYAVEKDPQLTGLLRTELMANSIENCEIMAADILRLDLAKFHRHADPKLIVMGNLPYNISSQVLIKLIHARDIVERAVVMFQQELAQRITAAPGNRQYGRITAMLGYCAEIKPLTHVPAAAFYPRPRVDSTVVEIRFTSTACYEHHDEAMLFRVIKAAFGNRRKTLKNALAASELQISPLIASRALETANIDPSRRAETLTSTEFVALEIALQHLVNGNA